MKSPVVDLVVIGAMKSGTTALYQFFKKNSVFAVNRKKEVNFFLQRYNDKSLLAYENSFLPGVMRVDVSPNYSKRHLYETDIAGEIFRANPKAKILYVVRDPLKRIESHLYHGLLRSRIDRNRISDMEYLKPVMQTSSYLFQLSPFLEYFGQERVLVLQQEVMKKNAQAFINSLFTFLDLPATDESTIDSYYTGEERYLIPKYDDVARVFGKQFLFRVYNPFWSFVNLKPAPVILEDDLKVKLRAVLRPDIDRLCSLYQLDKSLWSYFFENG